MAAMNKTSAFAVLLLAMLAVQQLAAASISCSDVVSDLSPCLSYLTGNDKQPSAECCAGVTTLVDAADTKEERQATCECLKAAYRQFHALLSAAQALPLQCGISLPYTISPDVDCSQSREGTRHSRSSHATKYDDNDASAGVLE
ncbi:hypothetical protein ACP70R_044324 [Stipagrostis hirtigluma subsp. patula]